MSSQLMEMSTDCFFIFDIFFIVVYVCIFLKNFVMICILMRLIYENR